MMNEKKKTILLRILVVSAFLVVIGVCIYLYLHFGKSAIELIKDTERFKAWIDGFGVWGVIVFLAIRIVQTVFKFIPTEPIEIAAGLVWGWFGGLMLCLLGNMIGSVIILIVTRRIGTRILRLFRLEKKMQSMRFLQDREKRNRLLFIFYLVPGTPKDTMTYFVALTDVNRVEFMILSSIARIPAIVSSTICGAYLGENNFKVAATVFIVTALLSIPGATLYKRISARYIQNHPQTGQHPQHGTIEPDGASEGCYIATCVYGSYDCPQVWTLRRFRDNTLKRTAPGRAFIRCYYALSPTLVRKVGETTAFRAFWRKVLDRMVGRLNENGVADKINNNPAQAR